MNSKVTGQSTWIRLIGLLGALSVAMAALLNPFQTQTAAAASLCGSGSAPDYGFTASLRQPHWTVGWEGHVSEQAVQEADLVLDELNEDAIAQTMVLILPAEQVGNRVNCAVHFLRYMQLGLPEGERKDNGFVFLIVVEPSSIDVHYGVGLGLPALTARELTNINRAAEEAYKSSGDLAVALRTLVNEFDMVARENYAPLNPSGSAEASREPAEATPVSALSLCSLLILFAAVLILFGWLGRRSGMAGTGTYGSWPGAYPGSSGGGSWFRGGGMGGSGSRGGGMGGSSTRGGSGSGRSGRGN